MCMKHSFKIRAKEPIFVRRSWETIAMFSCSLNFIMPFGAFSWMVTYAILLAGYLQYDAERPCTPGTILASLMTIYLSYVLFLDKAPSNGSRPPILRCFTSWWNHSCDYLPLLLVKTAELPPDHNYVLGYHPHGIISVGCFGAFATNGAKTLDLSEEGKLDLLPPKRGFSSLFPGLDRRVITLAQNFSTPFLREYFLSMGACTSDKETFRKVLSKPSTAVVVVVGGAAESMYADAGSLDLVLATRRGFVREAIRANASLVPVIAFGENDLYKTFKTSKESWIGKLQTFVKKVSGCAMPIFLGRSMVFSDWGMMPQRKPVIVVVGAPLAPPEALKNKPSSQFHPLVDRQTDKALNEDGEILKQHHAAYIQALEELYNQYKNAPWNAPGQDRRRSMCILQK